MAGVLRHLARAGSGVRVRLLRPHPKPSPLLVCCPHMDLWPVRVDERYFDEWNALDHGIRKVRRTEDEDTCTGCGTRHMRHLRHTDLVLDDPGMRPHGIGGCSGEWLLCGAAACPTCGTPIGDDRTTMAGALGIQYISCRGCQTVHAGTRMPTLDDAAMAPGRYDGGR